MAKSKGRALAVRPKNEVMAFGGGLEGAQHTSNETMLWHASRQSPDQIIKSVKEEADARGADSVRNDGYAMGIVDINRDHIVGSQYRLNAQPNITVLATINKAFDDTWAEEYQQAVEERFNLIADSPSCWLDASRKLSFTQQVRLVVAGFVFTGEHLSTAEWIREVDRPFYTAVQVISPSRLSNPDNQSDTQTLRNGVNKDFRGKTLGYHIRVSHPSEFYLGGTDSFRWNYVPAEKPWGRRQVIHIHDPLQPGQTRGVAGMVAVLKEMRMTKRFQEITLQNAVINASYAATIESELPSEVIAAAMGQGAAGDSVSGFMGFINTYLTSLNEYLRAANGIAVDGAKMPHLFPGTKLNARPLGTPGGVGTDFEVSLLRHIAAGLGISYEEFARDFSKTNYSSARASMLTTWKHMSARKRFVADRFADEVFTLWLEEDLADGNLPLPASVDRSVFYEPWGKEALSACEWIGGGRGQIDEMKETQASILRINAGLSTFESEIAKQGGDWRKVFRQRSRENKLAEDLDLVLTMDATKAGDANSQQTTTDPKGNDASGNNTGAEGINNTGVEEDEESGLETRFVAMLDRIGTPQFTINNVIPKRGTEKTVVTKHDENGRIKEFERTEVED